MKKKLSITDSHKMVLPKSGLLRRYKGKFDQPLIPLLFRRKVTINWTIFFAVMAMLNEAVWRGASAAFVAWLVWRTGRRRAAVARVEFRAFLVLYLATLVLQVLTTGAVLAQGSPALVVLTAIHAAAVAATFWALLGTGIVSTQVVEDGTLSSLIVSALVLGN